MKNYIFEVQGGGIFSKMLQCAIIPLADVDFDSVYLRFTPNEVICPDDPSVQRSLQIMADHHHQMSVYGIDDPYAHLAGYVLNQSLDSTYQSLGALPIGKLYTQHDPIEHSARFAHYKRVLKRLNIHSHIYKQADDHCVSMAISPRCLGVHVRLTTMNLLPLPKVISIENYFAAIDQEMESGHYDSIFVASDNTESLHKMEQRYGGIVRCCHDFLRWPVEEVLDWTWEVDALHQRRFWVETFVDCMILARCGGMICRNSNFSNAALVFSDSIQRVTRIDQHV